jgi:hypothetical protein
MPKLQYDYYQVSIPTDLGDVEDCAHQAIREAEDRARLYCLPCEWTARLISGDAESWNYVFRVRRRRNRVNKLDKGSTSA